MSSYTKNYIIALAVGMLSRFGNRGGYFPFFVYYSKILLVVEKLDLPNSYSKGL